MMHSNQPKHSFRHDLLNVGRGVLMGGADVVPGVSGGTVALIVGIYTQLVTAISRFDRELLSLLAQRRFRDAAAHVDLRFLAALGLGIGCGMVGLGLLIRWLWQDAATREPTLAAFLGMILASVYVVSRLLKLQTFTERIHAVIFAALGAIVALVLTMLPAVNSPGEPHLVYLFLCGAIGICAMILPGISGAYLLLILGVYVYLTDILHEVAHLNVTARSILTVAVFAAGCATGLLLFSRVLKFLLDRYQQRTMAVLCGFILGAAWKIWPFQQDLTPEIEKIKDKTFQHYMPQTIDLHVALTILAAVVAFALVIAVDFAGRSRREIKQELHQLPEASDG